LGEGKRNAKKKEELKEIGISEEGRVGLPEKGFIVGIT